MSTGIRIADVVAANPGPAVHGLALAVIALVGLAILGIARWRRGRETKEADDPGFDRPPSASSGPPTDED